MRPFRDLPIKWKLMLLILLISTAVLLIATTATAVYGLIRFRILTTRNQGTVTGVLAAYSSTSASVKDAKSAQQRLKTLRTNPDVVAARIYTPDGAVLAAYELEGKKISPFPAPPPTNDDILERNTLFTFRPINRDNQTVGIVAVQTDLTEQYVRIKNSAGLVAGMILVCALLTFALSARLQRIISDPIVALARVARNVRDQKDYSLRAAKTSQDEIGLLIDDFNDMLAQIQERDVILRTANAELKHRSNARRHAEESLRKANEVLQAEIRERQQAEKSLRQLSARLLHLQDEERRRIARELHDSTAQGLFALSMQLGHLDRQCDCANADARKTITDSMALTEQCSREIRTLAYLLHPPLLDEDGLASALHWYADGFAKRSNIKVELDMSPELDRLPGDVELTLFRIVQESLANIHRHSGSLTAKIRIALDHREVVLEVRDEGYGLPPDAFKKAAGQFEKLGVGIAGMRERLRQLGGTLEFIPANPGTIVRATLPLNSDAAGACTI